MTREEYEKQKQEALKNRKKSKFTASKGSFVIKPPEKSKNTNETKK